MEKVFTQKAFEEEAGRPITNPNDWAYKCIGKTKAQCQKMGFNVSDDWFEDVEEELKGEY